MIEKVNAADSLQLMDLVNNDYKNLPDIAVNGETIIAKNNQEAQKLLIAQAVEIIANSQEKTQVDAADARNKLLAEQGAGPFREGVYTHGLPLNYLATKANGFLATEYFGAEGKNASGARWRVYISLLTEIPRLLETAAPKDMLNLSGGLGEYSRNEQNVIVTFVDQKYRGVRTNIGRGDEKSTVKAVAFPVPFGIPSTDVTSIICRSSQYQQVMSDFVEQVSFYVPVYDYDTGKLYNPPEKKETTEGTLEQRFQAPAPKKTIPQKVRDWLRRLF